MESTQQTADVRSTASDSQPCETQINQAGSHFGATQVTGGYSLQGDFSDLTISDYLWPHGIGLNSTVAAPLDYLGNFSHSLRAPVKAFVAQVLLRDEIWTQLRNGDADGTTRTLAVWGLGGAGKTQLVLDYRRHYQRDYKATFWIDAEKKASLERDFVRLYRTLFRLHNPASQERISVDTALLVFDGADAIDDEKMRGYIRIKDFIPDMSSLHVVITTRSRVAKDMTQLGGVEVGDMDERQAVNLFCKCSELHDDDGNIKEVKSIVKELGYLALAITLAGTYVGTTRHLQSNIKGYLPEYRQRRRELLKRRPETLIHQYSESVLTTWETSYQAIIDSDCPEASVLMTILSFLSSDDIFPQLFGTGIQASIEELPSIDNYKIEDCFKMLERHTFVQ
ncbi:MAG: Kinesin light chain 3 [Bathelium mastoideum]|nr:MAG: Kinesin light chain 3 [Bathelium mastoideum]